MNEFSEAFADTFGVSHDIFGDTCTIAGRPIPCVIHGFDVAETVRPGGAGRAQNAQGVVIIKASDWAEARDSMLSLGRRQGPHVEIPGGTFRILNDPDVGYSSDTVELQLGPLS